MRQWFKVVMCLNRVQICPLLESLDVEEKKGKVIRKLKHASVCSGTSFSACASRVDPRVKIIRGPCRSLWILITYSLK